MLRNLVLFIVAAAIIVPRVLQMVTKECLPPQWAAITRENQHGDVGGTNSLHTSKCNTKSKNPTTCGMNEKTPQD
jgi:hypothetical protein